MTYSKDLLDEYQKLLKMRSEMEERIDIEIEKATARYEGWAKSQLDKDLDPIFIMAEGDSWFRYILGFGIIYHLERALDIEILNLAKPGDELRKMLSGGQRKRLIRNLSKGPQKDVKYDFLLFSGGGNDLVGQDTFYRWLHDYEEGMSAADIVDHSTLGPALRLIEDSYRDLVSIRNQHSRDTHLLLHSYDFAFPNGDPACFFGPWLEPGLVQRGVPEHLRKEVVYLFLSQFDRALDRVAAVSHGVTVVPTQGTLPLESDWENELHPTKDGFARIAAEFLNVIS